MSKPNVLITGCNGLIGEAVARRLLSEYHLIGADVSDPPEDSPLDEVRHMDVTSDASVQQTVDWVKEHRDGRLASVVHLAAFYDFSGEPSPLYDEITVQGTRRLLDALQDLHVEQFVFTSTMLVHAPVKPGEHIDEKSPLDAKWAYPESKLDTERVIHERRGEIPAVFLRIAGVYTDYGQQPTLVQQIKRIHAKDFQSFFFPGDLDAGQALVHLDDAAEAIARTIDHRATLPDETAILIGEPDPPSYGGLQDRIGELIWGTEWPTVRLPEPVAEAGAWIQDKTPGQESFIKPFMIELADDHYGLDVSRARTLLDWTPEHRLVDVLPTIVAGLQEDPGGWYERNGVDMPAAVTEQAGAQG
ncbi:MAG TPA: NAD(P)-dependent oxidoreductase [Longimicrobiales bacterium]|nr:NAD(P)-dependent oxidoreductase [Longimicrobiales bacterium]